MASASYLRLTKSETRDLAEHELRARRFGAVTDWNVSNGAFFTAFVIIAAVLATLALVLR